MAAWLIPALKAVLPHVGAIISTAAPVFTRKKDDARDLLLQQQITELQAAASQNSVHIRELAEQLQSTVAALEQTAAIADVQLRRALLCSIIATIFSAGALSAVLWVILS